MSWVYFIRYEDQVKIGLSGTPLLRFNLIQRQCPVRLEFLGAIPGSRAAEKEIHARWRAQNIRFDWFATSPDLLAYIAENAVPPPANRPRRRVPKRSLDPENWITACGPEPYNRVQ